MKQLFISIFLLVAVSILPAQDAYEPDETWEGGVQIKSGDTLTRSIHISSDVDWFRFDIAEGHHEVDFGTVVTGGFPEMTLYSINGTNLTPITKAQSESSNKWNVWIKEILPQGSYAVKMVDLISTNAEYKWAFTSTKVDVWYFNSTISGSGEVLLGGVNVPYKEGSSPHFSISPARGFYVDSVFLNERFIGKPTSLNIPATNLRNQDLRVVFSPVKDSYEKNSNPWKAAPILPGTYNDLSLYNGDYSDYYSFTLDAPMRVRIQADNTFDGTNLSLGLMKFVDNSAVATAKVNKSPSVKLDMDLEAGTHVFGIEGESEITKYKLLLDVRPLVPQNVTITVESSAGGSCDKTGSFVLEERDSMSVAIQPDEGHVVEYLIVNGDTLHGNYSLWECNDVIKNHDLFVKFRPLRKHTVTITSGANGTVSNIGTNQIVEGDSISVAFSANQGYRVNAIIIDNEDSIGINRDGLTFYDIQEDMALHIEFQDINGISVAQPKSQKMSPANLVQLKQGAIHYGGNSPARFQLMSLNGRVLAEFTMDGSGVHPLSGISSQVVLVQVILQNGATVEPKRLILR